MIIILYEESGMFTNLYRSLGYEVDQVDILIDGRDVRLLKDNYKNVEGLLAFPPCTDLAGSGARWWADKGEKALIDALSMVDVVYRLLYLHRDTIRFWMMENPVGRLQQYIGKPDFYFHPHEYAGYADNPEEEAYTKKTCLWGQFNIPERNNIEPVLGSKMHLLPPSKDRARLRSKTPQGFARAFTQVNK